MKKQVNPAYMAVAVVCALAAAGFFLFRAATDKPAYPGQMAGHPGQGQMKPPPMAGEHMSPEQAQKMGFSGANPNKK